MTTTAIPPIIVPCTTTLSALSAKKSMKTKMITAVRSSTIQSGSRDHALGAVHAVLAGVLPVGTLVEPLVERRLLGVGLRLDGLHRLEHRHAPGVDRVAEPARLHVRPLLVDDGARVADELAGELSAHGGGHELGRLELLHRDLRLGLGAAARGVVALEGEEDDEPEHDRESGREDPNTPAARSPS